MDPASGKIPWHILQHHEKCFCQPHSYPKHCGQYLDNEGIHAANCGRSTNFKKDHGTVAKAIYECAKSAAPQSDNRITEVSWDPKGLVNGDNSRPADIHSKINQKDYAIDVAILHTRTSSPSNIYANINLAIQAKELSKKNKIRRAKTQQHSLVRFQNIVTISRR